MEEVTNYWIRQWWTKKLNNLIIIEICFHFCAPSLSFLSKSSKLAKEDFFIIGKIFEMQNGGGDQLLNP